MWLENWKLPFPGCFEENELLRLQWVNGSLVQSASGEKKNEK